MNGVYYDGAGNLLGIKKGDNMSEKNCGSCRHHKYDKERKEWICANEESYNAGDYTKFSERCPDHEEAVPKSHR